jgi:hypothetical protein
VAEEEFPAGIDGSRHRDLVGLRSSDHWRRIIVGIAGAITMLALLDAFGQCARTTVARASAASLRLDGPSRVRGGLVYTSEIVITPSRTLGDARVWLARGWFEGMSVNTIEPSPTSEASRGPWIVFGLGRLLAGRPYRLWLSLQTNPTTVGRRTQDVRLSDGSTPIIMVRRTLFVFP